MSGFANNPFGGGGAAPAAPKPVMGAFVIPADPSWEPMEFGDFFKENGYFAFDIVGEKPVEDGVWLTLMAVDSDYAGLKTQTKLDDPNQDPKHLWKWRSLVLSITGNKDIAKGQIGYQQGIFQGKRCYGKTQTYTAKNGDPRTGLETFCTGAEHEQHTKAGRHRFPAVVKEKPSVGGFGAPGGLALPGGLPAGMPVPTPTAANPVQTAAAPAAPAAPPTAPTAPPATPAAAPSFGFPSPGPATGLGGVPLQPQQSAAINPPVPQPTAANPFAFPGK